MPSQPDNAAMPRDYWPVLQRLLPGFAEKETGPVHDLKGYLVGRFGPPQAANLADNVIRHTYGDGTIGLNVFERAGLVVGVSSLAFTYPFWKPCPQSRFSGAWIVGTGTSSFIPLIGSAVAATAAAAAVALADYYLQAALETDTLCDGLCTKPCWCTTDTRLPSRNTVITTKSVFGIPVLITITVTFSGWVLASCEGWPF